MIDMERMFLLSEMTPENGWVETFYRTDGKREFRQLKPLGNWHVEFEPSATIGTGHWDKYNATGDLVDKYNHLSLYVSEQLGTSEGVGKVIVAAAAYKVLKWLLK